MKANELMIGDYVNYRGQIIKVTSLYDKGGSNEVGWSDKESVWVNVINIEPIPLTTEILKKNGFTKSTPPPGIHARCYDLDNKKEKYHLTIANYNKYKRLLLNVDSEDSECFNIKCDYVHELQHALRLCGIKKEIEL